MHPTNEFHIKALRGNSRILYVNRQIMKCLCSFVWPGFMGKTIECDGWQGSKPVQLGQWKLSAVSRKLRQMSEYTI